MKKARAARAGKTAARPRKHRPRPTPKWLIRSTQLEAVARARCLLVLSVLSGEVPVSEAIAQAKISRGTYYQLEAKALKAVLVAMSPLASNAPDGTADLSMATEQIARQQKQIRHLEQDKRRMQRLLLLTRKTVRAPVMMGRRGRPPKRSRLPTNPAKMAAPNLPSSPTPLGVHSP